MPESAKSALVRFETFDFDRELGELRKNGVTLRVQEKTLRLLEPARGEDVLDASR